MSGTEATPHIGSEASELATPELFAWARAGLLHYEQQSLIEHSTEIDALQRRVATALTGYPDMEWREIGLLLGEQLQRQGGGLAQLMVDPQRDLPQFYLFTLCSAIELDSGVAPLLARIQDDSDPAWLQLGTAAAVLSFLFSEITVSDLTAFRLVLEGIVQVDGQGPAVQRHLFTSGSYWQALAADRLLPECRSLARVPDEAFAAELISDAVRLIEAGNGLVLNCDRQTAQGFVARLASELGCRPVGIAHADWRQPALRALAGYARWLPLVDCLTVDGELTGATGERQHAVLLLRAEQQLRDGYLRLTLPLPDAAQRRRWWQQWVSHDETLSTLAAAPLELALIAQIGRQLSQPDDVDLLGQVRKVRSADASAELRRVALPVDTHVDDQMLVLPDETLTALQRCYQRCLQRDYQQLGMGASIRATASNGVVLLFSGASGTGKTLASSWLASRLAAPLFKIDLAMVMNKYVGETEKNLSLALTEAAATDAMLLFDEADALFGRRGDGTHGGDRFANMLTNFLLSRIETHSGIVVLTTNAGNRMDTAFQRRIDVAVEFQPLGFDDRLRLWRSLLAGRTPADAVCARIARHCELAPGHVRNIVVNACCWYPDQFPLSVGALWQALDQEYRKVGRSMPSQLMALQPSESMGDGSQGE